MKCMSPVWVRAQMLHVPCGKCAFCIRKSINAWCMRLRHELDVSSSAYFLTLTYNDEHLPKDGELSKSDLNQFLRRLRKRNPGIRYFAVGEYGENNARPHYHAVIFNLVNLDLVTASWTNALGENLGFIKGNKANAGRIRYMVSYMALPQDVSHRQPPFRVMSRRPGIGSTYVERMGPYHRARSDCVVYDFDCANAMPRYYMDKIFDEGQRRYLHMKRMMHSLENPTVVCSIEHDRLWTKLNRKNKNNVNFLPHRCKAATEIRFQSFSYSQVLVRSGEDGSYAISTCSSGRQMELQYVGPCKDGSHVGAYYAYGRRL